MSIEWPIGACGPLSAHGALITSAAHAPKTGGWVLVVSFLVAAVYNAALANVFAGSQMFALTIFVLILTRL